MTKTIYIIRQTQEVEYYDRYAFIAYEDYDKAQKHCDELNKEYGNEYEVDSDMAHFYEVDTIDLVLESEE